MKNFLFYSCIFLFAIISCKPDKITDVVVEGVLLDASSLKPIEGGTVEINTGTAGLAGTGSAHTKFMDMQTDANGKFHFEYTIEEGLMYVLYADAPHHYGNRSIGTWSITYNGESPSKRTNLTLQKKAQIHEVIRLPPQGTLRIRIINVDKIYDRFNLNTPPGSPLASGLQLSGMNVDETHEFTVYGDVENILSTFRYRPGDGPGEGDHVTIPVFCKAHDVTEYTVEY
ncbi:hypothetical protein [Negadavirga shengliensis]|uniref:Carboxypeptidase regulatory-like domain-containing protein n=1 Tax=Negadavirga shengliensis TaxID=1389218 RepID=A0ABV9T0Q4_9BACT